MAKSDQQEQKRKQHASVRFSDYHFAANYFGGERNDLKEVNKVGARYAKNPSSKDADFLIRAFHGFLMKYVLLLTPRPRKEYRAITADTRDFLRLFMSRADRSPSQLKRAYREVAERLPNMAIQTGMAPDDLYNELVVIFLERASRFNPDIGGFTGYIKYHFKYAVKTRLFELQNDPINYQPLYEEDMEVELGEDQPRLYDGWQYSKNSITDRYLDLPVLTPRLISNPEEPFNWLWSKQERAIIVKIYYEDKSFNAAAEDLGYSNAVIVRQMHDQALQKFRDHAHGKLKRD